MVLVKDVMNVFVCVIERKNTILEAAKKMSIKGVSCLVVFENEPIGMITRRDILEKVVAKKKDPAKIKVGQIMSSPVITIHEDSTLIAASGIMNKKKIKQLPVVSHRDLGGIVTQTDIVRNINAIIGYDRK